MYSFKNLAIMCNFCWKDLIKWYLIPPCLTLRIIRYISRVKWSNPSKGVPPCPTGANFIYIYIYIYIYTHTHTRGAFNKFPDCFVQAFEIVVDSWKFSIYCYTSYEMTDQFLWFQVQMNSYSSNWNTPY